MCAVPSIAVLCSSFMLCFPAMFFTNFINDFGMVVIVPIINAITFIFKFHITCIHNIRALYFKILAVSLNIITITDRMYSTYSLRFPPGPF